MRHYIYTFLVLTIVCFTSCRKDFDFETSSGGLEFSRDTVYLDTVFANIGSSTYTLKVYNRSNKDISIPSVKLGKGLDSKYRITVDGMTGNDNKIFTNVEVLAKDSLYIYIQTTAAIGDANPTDFLYTDEIQFSGGGVTQNVNLVTLIQDAVFLYPARNSDGTYETLPIGGEEVYGFFLDDSELHWTAQKPYVIYGYAAIPGNKTLTIDPGAKIHFHSGSGLIAANNASLQVNGTLADQVVFEGDRLEPTFSDTPGQWGTIWLTSGSVNNSINYATIKNAGIGILVENAPLIIKNTQLYNHTNSGILARTGVITGENVVISRTGESTFAGTYGGTYNFSQSTFGNYWNSGSRSAPTVTLTNFIETSTGTLTENLQNSSFTNCIIYGNNNLELGLSKNNNAQFQLAFNYCLIKFIDFSGQYGSNPLYQFTSSTASSDVYYNNCLIAKTSTSNNPRFINPGNNNLKIQESSAARNVAPSTPVPNDILGNPRSTPADLGAYNYSAE